MSKFHFTQYIFLGALSLTYIKKVQATADGPDFFKSKDTINSIVVYESPDIHSNIVQTLHAPISSLRNLGCKQNSKKPSNTQYWCNISRENVRGWVQNQFLVEDGYSVQPSFDCNKSKGEIENTICQYQHLSKLDNHLKDVFEQAIKTASSIGERPKIAVKIANFR